jgi:hypothetical protein
LKSCLEAPARSRNSKILAKIHPTISMPAGLEFWLGTAQGALAIPANAWHVPDDAGDLGFNVRNPWASYINGPASRASYFRIQFSHKIGFLLARFSACCIA